MCCPACGAPLRLPDEPTPVALSRTLDLDRRRSRTPIPASAPPPPVAGDEEGDLGDLSFDPPSDDGPWTMSARPPLDDGPEPGPDVDKTPAPFDGAESEPFAVSTTPPAPALDGRLELGDEHGPGEHPAEEDAAEEDVGDGYSAADGDDAASDEADADESDDDAAADDEDDDETEEESEDDDAERAADGLDPVALQRGRVLSLASVAIAGAAVLVAVLSWR